MKFKIDDVRDIAKLIGALRLMSKGEFKVSKEMLEEVLARLHRFAIERGITIKIISPSGERIIEFTAKGIIVGAALGFYLGQLPGALIGAVIGGVAGYCASHMILVMENTNGADHVVIQVA